MLGTVHCPLELWMDIQDTIEVFAASPNITPAATVVLGGLKHSMLEVKQAQFKEFILCPK